MINLLCVFRYDDHPIRLNQVFFLDQAWWQEFLPVLEWLQLPSVTQVGSTF